MSEISFSFPFIFSKVFKSILFIFCSPYIPQLFLSVFPALCRMFFFFFSLLKREEILCLFLPCINLVFLLSFSCNLLKNPLLFPRCHKLLCFDVKSFLPLFLSSRSPNNTLRTVPRMKIPFLCLLLHVLFSTGSRIY